ncbi:PIN domain-containing protein [Halomonas faecis]|uniref:PIN domain-containing protein n=1 Tax=Halomonas faecis TaxID=1562110 RepID=UPI0013D04C53|nr:PIN domain-containing protein [Halomonas faecis]
MLLLISDANVIIDLEAGELIEKLFELPYRFATPDVLYEEEIEPDSPHLAGWGLEVLVIGGDYIDYAVELGHRYGDEPSFNDRLALALAKQESCPLLTGDQNLRVLAVREQAEVRGTIWIFTELIEFGKVSKETAHAALAMMKQRDRRLPWDKARKYIDETTFGIKKRTDTP